MFSLKKTFFFIILFIGVQNILTAQQREVNELLVKLKKNQPDSSRLVILSHLSSAYMAVDPELTYRYALDLKKLALKTGQLKKSADADVLLGISWGIRSRYDSSLYYFRESLIQAEKIKYNIGIADAYINMGEVFSRLDDDVKASAYYLRALPLFENSKYLHGVNLCLNNLGDIYCGQKSYQIALNYYNRALDNYRLSKNKNGEALVTNSIAFCYFNRKEFGKSLEAYTSSLKIRKKIGDLSGQADDFAGIGSVYTALQQYDKASWYLFKAKEYLEKIQDKDYLATVYQQLADNYLKQNKLRLSATYAFKSLTIAQKIKSKTKTANALKTLSEIHRNKGDFKAAYNFQSDYLRCRDSVFNDEKLKNVGLLSLERSQAEITSLTKNNELKAALLEKNTIKINLYNTIFGLGLLILLLMTLQAWVLYKSSKQKKSYNELLEKQRNEIAEFNEDLTAINEALITQMEITVNQNKELAKINQMKNKLYAMISHDFRSPLCTLKNLMALWNTGDVSNEEMPEYLSEVSGLVDQTYMFLENLLIWSKSQMDGTHIQPVKFNIRNIITEKTALFYVQAKMKDVSLIINLSDEPLMVFADEAMVRLVIRNLLANAIKFTGKDGTITFYAESRQSEVMIAIKDTGMGMSADAMANLFNGGYTSIGTKQEKGSGLGLMMCYEFISLNRGRIWAESRLGLGSTFYFTLPT